MARSTSAEPAASVPFCLESCSSQLRSLPSCSCPPKQLWRPEATCSTVASWLPSGGPPEATARGFEPLRAEPNGFLVHHLNHSVTLSMEDVEQLCQNAFSMLGVRSCARARPTWRAPPAQSLARQCHWPRVLQLAADKPSFLLLSSKTTVETGSYLLHCGLLASLRGTSRSDSEGIRTPAGRAQWISSPSP